jgi:hypothetical protein
MAQESKKRSSGHTRSSRSRGSSTSSGTRKRGATNGQTSSKKTSGNSSSQKTSGKSSPQKTSGKSSPQKTNGRSASQKTEKYRFAQNVEGELTRAEQEYRAYATGDGEIAEPDILLAVPVVKVDRIHLKLEQLDAHIAVKAKVLDLLKLTVGVDVHLGKLEIDIEGVEAQALAKVRLDYVAAMIDRILTAVDRNPELVENLAAAVEHIGSGAGEAVDETGEGAEHVGEGAKQAIGEIGEGAGQAVEGAGEAVGGVGEGAGQAVGGVGEGAGQAVGGVGEGVGDAAGGAVGGAAGGLLGGGDGQGGSGANGGGDGGAPSGISAPQLAKEAVKLAAKQLGSVASDEAKDLSLAATRKVMEMGERHRENRADKHNATAAALREAGDAGIDIEEIEGTGADGRVTLRDVQKAQRS